MTLERTIPEEVRKLPRRIQVIPTDEGAGRMMVEALAVPSPETAEFLASGELSGKEVIACAQAAVHGRAAVLRLT